MSTPTKYDDIIDSRDVIARIEELQGERETLVDEVESLEDALSGFDLGDNDDADIVADLTAKVARAQQDLEDWDADNAHEIKELTDLASEGENYASDWKYGETLIRDSYFRDYAQELAEDLDLVKKDVNWPYTCIDWDRAARELQYDYSTISFGDVDYWIRSC